MPEQAAAQLHVWAHTWDKAGMCAVRQHVRQALQALLDNLLQRDWLAAHHPNRVHRFTAVQRHLWAMWMHSQVLRGRSGWYQQSVRCMPRPVLCKASPTQRAETCLSAG